MNDEIEVATEEVAPNPVESQAREQNWRPKEEWVENGGDPTKWKDAATFVRDGELFSKISELKNQTKAAQQTAREAQQQVNVIRDHYNRVEEAAKQRLISDLKSAKKQALEDGDAGRVVEIDDQISNLKTVQAQQAVQAQQQRQAAQALANQPNPEFVEWVGKNPWYSQDQGMQEEADGLGIAHAQRNPNKSAGDVLKYVDQQIRKLHPEKFSNPNREHAPKVEGTSTPVNRGNDSFELSPEERQVMNTLLKIKGPDGKPFMTKDKYISDLKDKFYTRG